MSSPRIIFMGTPEFAVPALQALIQERYSVVGVYSQPPRPKNRGYKVTKSPVHMLAQAHSIPVFTPLNFKSKEDQDVFQALKPDIAIVAAYGLILPQSILSIPRHGCINIHGSLLPRWRGAAPIHRAIMAGDQETGITLMHMDKGLDTGDMITKNTCFIKENSTFELLHNQLASMGAKLLIKTLPHILNQSAPRTVQPVEGVTYAHKLEKSEGCIDWHQTADTVLRHINALHLWPGAATTYQGKTIKIRAASRLSLEDEMGIKRNVTAPHDSHDSFTASPGALVPGTLLNKGHVVCGDGHLLSLDVLQKEGGKPLEKDAFLRGFSLNAGNILGAPVHLNVS